MKTILITTLISLLLVAIIGLATQNFCLSWQMDDLERQADAIYWEGWFDGRAKIKSVRELQGFLGIKRDGIVGPITLAAWDKLYCQQEANIQINAKSMGLEK